MKHFKGVGLFTVMMLLLTACGGRSGNSFSAENNAAFSGDVIKFFGLKWNEALALSGDGSDSSDVHRIANNIEVRLITNNINGTEIHLKNSINGPSVVRQVTINKEAKVTFSGISIGNTLAVAEQRLTSAASRIKGGVVGYIEEIDGNILQIFIGANSFLNKDQVKKYLQSGAEMVLNWTVEINGTIYDVALTTSNKKNIDSITVVSYDNEEIQLGVIGDPFKDISPASSMFTVPSKPVGIEGLDIEYWN